MQLRYAKARDQIRTGDLLLYKPRWWAIHSRLICVAGRTPYCHAAMAYWNRSTVEQAVLLSVLEMCARGGRQSSLAEQVDRYPGLIDVFESGLEHTMTGRRQFYRHRAVEVMTGFVGRRYGWWNLLRTSLVHLPFVRLLVRPSTDDQLENGHPPFCSQAIAAACRAGGVDPVPNLADRMTEPGDLARSPFFKYRFTLVP